MDPFFEFIALGTTTFELVESTMLEEPPGYRDAGPMRPWKRWFQDDNRPRRFYVAPSLMKEMCAAIPVKRG